MTESYLCVCVCVGGGRERERERERELVEKKTSVGLNEIVTKTNKSGQKVRIIV